jgi:hypothetical protein
MMSDKKIRKTKQVRENVLDVVNWVLAGLTEGHELTGYDEEKAQKIKNALGFLIQEYDY